MRPREVIGETPQTPEIGSSSPEFYRAACGAICSPPDSGRAGLGTVAGGEAFPGMADDQRGSRSGREAARYVAVFNDVTELHHKDERLRHQAYHDVPTGLPNRLLLQDRLRYDMDVAARNSEVLATMVLDLDNFKLINDSPATRRRRPSAPGDCPALDGLPAPERHRRQNRRR